MKTFFFFAVYWAHFFGHHKMRIMSRACGGIHVEGISFFGGTWSKCSLQNTHGVVSFVRDTKIKVILVPRKEPCVLEKEKNSFC